MTAGVLAWFLRWAGAVSCRRRRGASGGSAGGSDSLAESCGTAPCSPTLADVAGTPEDLKTSGNELFARGEIDGAIAHWLEARRRAAEAGLDVAKRDRTGSPDVLSSGQQHECTQQVQDSPTQRANMLRVLDSSLALGHLRRRAWATALGHADAALACPGPPDVKVLHRRALALAGLRRWVEAEQTLLEFEKEGGGTALASQLRLGWERDKRAMMGRVASALREPVPSTAGGGEASEWDQGERWVAPKLSWMSVFDLRQKGEITFQEKGDDFSDEVWTPDGVSGRTAVNYSTALPLTVLAVAVLARLHAAADITIHMLHGSESFQAHDWSAFLARCPGVCSLRIVYIDLHGDGRDSVGSMLRPANGVLTEASEESRVDERVASISRFTGSYGEFLQCAAPVPEILTPWLAVLADLPLACGGATAVDRLSVYLDALTRLAEHATPVAVTLPASPKDRTLRVPAQRAMAALRLLGARQLVPWQWNRFTVPSKHVGRGAFVAAFAVVGVVGEHSHQQPPRSVLEGLDARGVPREDVDNDEDDSGVCGGGGGGGGPGRGAEEKKKKTVQSVVESEEFRKKHAAFLRKMEREGRPLGEHLTREEQHRQGLEFAHWSLTAPRSEWDEDAPPPKVEEVNEEDLKEAEELDDDRRFYIKPKHGR